MKTDNTQIVARLSQYIGYLRQQLKTTPDYFEKRIILKKITNAETVLIDLGAITEEQRMSYENKLF